jgi:hypothetical protein
MTEKELQQQIDRAMQDAITLDFSKWSAQRIQAKLSTDHNQWQIERDRTLARQQNDNAEVRARHLNKLQTDREAKRADADAQTEIQLQPQKQTLMREWLASNPTQTAADFDKKAWHLLKENLIEQRKTDALDADIKANLATGRYSL